MKLTDKEIRKGLYETNPKAQALKLMEMNAGSGGDKRQPRQGLDGVID